jgi:putative ABC transport system permease protein
VAQRLIGREGKLTAIAVKVDDLRRLEEVRRALRGMLPEDYFVITAQELSEGVMTFFASTRAIMGVMVLIALLLAVLGISNTMLMTVTERRREFGYLRCVGAGTGDIIRLIAGETFIVCAAGAVGGVAAASALVPMFERFIRSTLTSYIPAAGIVQLHAVYAAVSVAVVILVGVAASLYPALKAARIPPMEVVRDA